MLEARWPNGQQRTGLRMERSRVLVLAGVTVSCSRTRCFTLTGPGTGELFGQTNRILGNNLQWTNIQSGGGGGGRKTPRRLRIQKPE